MLRVAVASNDGTTIDEHFGRAKLFRIYEVEDNGTARLLESREILPPSPDSPAPAHGADVTIEQLSDVDAVLALRIGPNSQQSFSSRGIRSFALGGPLEKALSSYGRRHKLLDTTIPGIPAGYSCADKGSCCSSSDGCR